MRPLSAHASAVIAVRPGTFGRLSSGDGPRSNGTLRKMSHNLILAQNNAFNLAQMLPRVFRGGVALACEIVT